MEWYEWVVGVLGTLFAGGLSVSWRRGQTNKKRQRGGKGSRNVQADGASVQVVDTTSSGAQVQLGGEGSTNVQTENLNVITGGVSHAEVLEVVRGELKSNEVRSGKDGSPDQTVEVASLAEAVMRGPMRQLEVDAKYEQAQKLAESAPVESAKLFGEVASVLDESPFYAHANRARVQQADSLLVAGEVGNAVLIWLELGWADVWGGDPFDALRRVGKISEAVDLADELVRSANMLSKAAGRRQEFGVKLQDLAAELDVLLPGDPHYYDAVLFLVEECVADRDLHFVADRQGVLAEAIGRGVDLGRVELELARLRCGVADAVGGWNSVVTWGRSSCESRTLSLVLARHARYAALHSDFEVAEDRVLEAIGRACQEGVVEDAAHWLYALRHYRVSGGGISSEINEPHHLAQAIQSKGSDRLLPQPYEPKLRALSAMRNESWPAAYVSLRRYLWQSSVSGSISEELDAHEMLGDLLSETGEYGSAFQHYVFAGAEAKIRGASKSAPDDAIVIPEWLLAGAPWQSSATYVLVEVFADLLSDESASEWSERSANTAMANLLSERLLGVPDLAHSALGAFSKLGDACSLETANEFLAYASELIPRETGRFRPTDKYLVEILAQIARSHDSLRAMGVGLLLDAMDADPEMAGRVQASCMDLIRLERDEIMERLEDMARRQNVSAILALVRLDVLTDDVISFVRADVARMSAVVIHQPGRLTFGTSLRRTAIFATALDEDEQLAFVQAMVTRSNDVVDSLGNRGDAIYAIATVAESIPSHHREGMFIEACEFARGEQDGTSRAVPFENIGGPLDRFRVDMGDSSLRVPGLYAAVALADTGEEFGVVQEVALNLLASEKHDYGNSVAQVLTRIPPEFVVVDIATLASHSSEWIRCLAAVLWAGRPDIGNVIGEQLSKDSSHNVRWSLARSLTDDARYADLKDRLSLDPRRSVRAVLRPGRVGDI